MSQGKEAIVPHVQTCPCCGEYTYYDQTETGGCKIKTENVHPECVQAHDPNGVLLTFRLYWVCNICGCRWVHGQDMPKGNQ